MLTGLDSSLIGRAVVFIFPPEKFHIAIGQDFVYLGDAGDRALHFYPHNQSPDDRTDEKAGEGDRHVEGHQKPH